MSAALPFDTPYIQTAVAGTAPSRQARRFVATHRQSAEQRNPLYFLRQGAPELEEVVSSAPLLLLDPESAAKRFSQWLSVSIRLTHLDATTKLLWANASAPQDSETLLSKYDRIARSIEDAAAGAREGGWDSYDAKPASADSTRHALEFVSLLPPSLPTPDVLVDRDGEINLEWYCNPSHVFSISFAPDGALSYAALFGSGRVHGSELLGEDSLSQIVHNIKRVWRD